MAALLQSYSQQSGTITMLQTRPSSSSGMLPQGQPQNQPYGGNQGQRNSFYGNSGPIVGQQAYRTSSGPIQPYAFTSTPNYHPSAPRQQNAASYRTASSPAVPTMQSFDAANGRPRYPASASMTNLSQGISAGYNASGSRDDSSLPAVGGRRHPTAPRPQSVHLTGAATAMATQVTFTQATPIRVSPERYRRPVPRTMEGVTAPPPPPRLQTSAQPSGSGMANVSHLYTHDQRPNMVRNRTPSSGTSRPTSLYSVNPVAPTDDSQTHRRQINEDEAKRLRRRSMPALDSSDFSRFAAPQEPRKAEEPTKSRKAADRESKTARVMAPANVSGETENSTRIKNGSAESLASNRSAPRPSSSTTPGSNAPTANPAGSMSASDASAANSGASDNLRLVTIPPRGSSTDASKTIPNPSPLSKPITMDSESDATAANASSKLGTSPQAPGQGASPAAQHLAAISQKTGKPKSKTSRLRRAFSFGSAAELRKASNPETIRELAGTDNPSKLQNDPAPYAAYDAEQARIAQQQEEAGIGNNIYAGAKIFAGSTDNLSISSTASSASIMIRKMGRGMKKGGRSLVGLFRPKSIIGAPSADAQAPEASQAAVSMITVEAERERVNVNADPHSRNGGGTGFPRLERNSIDASKTSSLVSDRLGSSGTDNSGVRKSIVGGDRERAEVLAAVRKGILKRRGASPSPSRGNPNGSLRGAPAMSDSPNSSAPSTPNDDVQGHKRTGSVAIGSEDYFMTALRLRQDTKSAPATPQGSTPTGTMRRNATFSPRIVFHDTWPSQEYDRRGEIATCNRLTPMLAQQIKEELNSFKMEMEVHENSKIYTHFF
ncbi:hypothetical protein RB594_003020 [Gaeumannomyces avenae]